MDEQVSILDINVEEVEELQTIPDGEEVLLEIIKAEVRNSAKGLPMLVIQLGATELQNTKSIFEYMVLPHAYEDDIEKKAAAGRKLKRFCQAFNLPMDSLNLEAIVGETGYAIVKAEEYEGETNNKVRKYIARR